MRAAVRWCVREVTRCCWRWGGTCTQVQAAEARTALHDAEERLGLLTRKFHKHRCGVRGGVA